VTFSLLLSKLSGAPGLICEKCKTLFPVVAIGGGMEADEEGGNMTSATCSML
jgi:hypothetical protein